MGVPVGLFHLEVYMGLLYISFLVMTFSTGFGILESAVSGAEGNQTVHART